MIEISGHRGCRTPHIENTAAAFKYCIDNKIDWIEFDVKKTRDNKLIVFHDRTIDRLLNGKGEVEKMTLEEIMKFRYKDGQSVITLEELFELTRNKIKLMLEIKSRGIAKELMDLVHAHDYQENEMMIISFVNKDIIDCYKLDNRPIYGKCISYIGKSWLWKILGLQGVIGKLVYKNAVGKYPVSYINLDAPFGYDEFVKLAVSNNVKHIMGAMQTEKYLKKLVDWNVEIVNCDDPVKIKNIIESEYQWVLRKPE